MRRGGGEGEEGEWEVGEVERKGGEGDREGDGEGDALLLAVPGGPPAAVRGVGP